LQTRASGKVSENGEGRAADGIVKIPTTYSQDTKAQGDLNTMIKSGKDYNGCYYNCSTFAQTGLRSVIPNFDASQNVKIPWHLKALYSDAKVVAPNNLYNAALKVKGATNIKGPSSVQAKPYLQYWGK
jgi:hypothetical protein